MACGGEEGTDHQVESKGVKDVEWQDRGRRRGTHLLSTLILICSFPQKQIIYRACLQTFFFF